MAVRQINQPPYAIDLSGFEDLIFTESSREYLSLPSSVGFAGERQSVLQSAREAWAFRIGADSQMDSNKYQSTRTAALGLKIDGDYYIAIDDSPDPTKNILLARAQDGYDAHCATGKWLLSKQDPVIDGMLARAEQGGRLFHAPEATLVLPTNQRTGTSSYSAHPIPQAIVGRDLAATVASYLSRQGNANGYVWTLSPSNLEQLGVDNDHVEVRRVVVGVVGVDDLGADGRCDDVGGARGARENSTGNRG
jgi:hypothetical protein